MDTESVRRTFIFIRSFGRGQAPALRGLHQALYNVGQGLVPCPNVSFIHIVLTTRYLSNGFALFPKTALAFVKRTQRAQKVDLSKGGPVTVAEVVLGIRALPQ